MHRFLLPGVVGRRERDVSVWRDVQHTVFRLDPDAKQLDVLRRVGSHTCVILKQSKHLRGSTEEFSCMWAELHKHHCCSPHISMLIHSGTQRPVVGAVFTGLYQTKRTSYNSADGYALTSWCKICESFFWVRKNRLNRMNQAELVRWLNNSLNQKPPLSWIFNVCNF